MITNEIRPDEPRRIVGVWIETTASSPVVCAALQLPVSNHQCERLEGELLVSISIEKTHTRVGCAIANTVDD